jgi:hypothetical protein
LLPSRGGHKIGTPPSAGARAMADAAPTLLIRHALVMVIVFVR